MTVHGVQFQSFYMTVLFNFHWPSTLDLTFFWIIRIQYHLLSGTLIQTWNTVIFHRLNVIQSVFGVSIEFSMRTFLFKTNGSSADEQQQTISCNLHLDPADSISSTQPDDCSCHSEEECSGNIWYFSRLHFETFQNLKINHKNVEPCKIPGFLRIHPIYDIVKKFKKITHRVNS